MYVMEKAFPNKKIGHFLAVSFAFFAVFASFGMGNMTQANSIADALAVTFRLSKAKSGSRLRGFPRPNLIIQKFLRFFKHFPDKL